jgi:4-amino-4-deoxy-L-arabinose transferase-like glycosyltransferase
MLYKVFGYHEYIYKLVNILIGFTGLLFLFRLGLRTFQNTLYALILPLIIFSSPIYVYYTNNFIPDASSLSIVFIAFYYFYRFYEEGRHRDILKSLILFGLAGLLKTPAFLLFFAIIGVFVLERVFNISIKKDTYIFINWIKTSLMFLIVMLVAFAWYAYAKIYTDHHGGIVSLVEIRPIWRLSNETINVTWKAMVSRFHEGHYHYKYLIVFMALLFINNLVFWKKYNRLISWLTVLCFFGGISFTLLFFRSMRNHDYYQMNNLILFVLLILNFILFLKINLPRIYHSWITKSLFIIILFMLVFKCRNFVDRNYYSGWYMDYALETYNNRYGNITPYLRSLGIDRYDKVYVTPDPSINISLYLMDQKGFTDFFMTKTPFQEKIDYFRNYGLQYVLIGDLEAIGVAPEETGLSKIGEYNDVGIYRVD